MAVDTVVIGSGAFGGSTAFHLAAAGRSVVLIDGHEPGSQTSPRAAGLATAVHGNDAGVAVARRSLDKLHNFERETGLPLPLHVTGSVKVARRPEHVAIVEAELARGLSLGLDVVALSAGEVAERGPFVVSDEVLAAVWCPDDLYLDPAALTSSFIAAAMHRGTRVLSGSPVADVQPSSAGFLTALEDGSTIESRTVVNAAGAWCRPLAARSGVDVPALPIRHQLLITAPLPQVTADMPCVRIIDTQCYMRPASGGLMFGAYERDPVGPDERLQPSNISNLALDAAPLRALMADCNLASWVLDADVSVLRGGLPTMTPDGGWLVGETPELPGYFVLNGDNVAGLSTSPALGEALAQQIITGTTPDLIKPYGLNRIPAADREPERLRQLCRERYVARYVDHG